MTAALDIMNSTAEERRIYIKNKFPCIADCDMCGIIGGHVDLITVCIFKDKFEKHGCPLYFFRLDVI